MNLCSWAVALCILAYAHPPLKTLNGRGVAFVSSRKSPVKHATAWDGMGGRNYRGARVGHESSTRFRVRSAPLVQDRATGRKSLPNHTSPGAGVFELQKRLNKRIVDCKRPNEVIQIADDNLNILNHINVITSLHRIAKLDRNFFRNLQLHDIASERLRNKTSIYFDIDPMEDMNIQPPQRKGLNRLLKKVEENVEYYDCRGISSVLWTYASLEYQLNTKFKESLEGALRRTAKGFNSQGVSNSLWALAKLSHRVDDDLMDSLVDRSADLRMQWTPQCVSNTLWAIATFASIGYTPPPDYVSMAEKELVEKIKFFKPQELSITMWSLGKLQHQPTAALWTSVEKRLQASASYLKPQELSNILWAFARLGHLPSEHLQNLMLMQASRRIEMFRPQAIGNSVWAMAKLHLSPDDNLLDKIQKNTIANIEGFNMQNLHNTLWAFAVFAAKDKPSDAFMKATYQRVFKAARHLRPADIANHLWSCAVLEKKPPEQVLRVLEYRALNFVQKFTPHELANIFWGMGVLSHRPTGAFMSSFEDTLTNIVHSFTTYEMSSVVVGYGKLAWTPSNSVLKALERQVISNIQEYHAPNLVSLLWAFAKFTRNLYNLDEMLIRLQDRAEDLMETFTVHEIACIFYSFAKLSRSPTFAVLKQSQEHMLRTEKFSSFDISNLLWSFAKLKQHPDPRLLAKLESKALTSYKTFSPQGIANSLWAFVTLNHQPSKELTKAFQDQSMQMIDSFNAQEVSNILWALANTEKKQVLNRLVMSLHRRATAVDTFTSQEATTILWSFLKLSVQVQGVLLNTLKKARKDDASPLA